MIRYCSLALLLPLLGGADPQIKGVAAPGGSFLVALADSHKALSLFVSEASENPGSAYVVLDSSQVAGLAALLTRFREQMQDSPPTPSDPSAPVPDYVAANEPACLVSMPGPPIDHSVSEGGVVLVRVLVNVHGTVDRAEVIEGNPALGAVALEVARCATFKPALSSRRPKSSWALVPVHFSRGASE